MLAIRRTSQTFSATKVIERRLKDQKAYKVTIERQAKEAKERAKTKATPKPTPHSQSQDRKQAAASSRADPAGLSVRQFFEAVEEGKLDIVRRALTRNQALATLANEDGETALFFANTPAIAELLLAQGAAVNYVSEETGETALFAISSPGIVGLLARHGADLDHKSSDGLTAHEVFAEDENQAMCEAIQRAKEEQIKTKNKNLNQPKLTSLQRMRLRKQKRQNRAAAAAAEDKKQAQ